MLTGRSRATSARGSGVFRGRFLVDVSDVTEPTGDGRFGGVRMRSISAAAPRNSLLSSIDAASKRAREAGDGARRGADFAGDGARLGGFACRSARSDSE